MNFWLYGLYQYFGSPVKSLLICKSCIYLKLPFRNCLTSEKSLKNAMEALAQASNLDWITRESPSKESSSQFAYAVVGTVYMGPVKYLAT